jgi:hypothetical protein
VSVEVVSLLLRAGASEAEVEELLGRAVGSGQSVARTLEEAAASLRARFDRELTRMETPSIELVRPEVEQLALLPAGLSERLGAVPVRRDPRSGRVDVAVLDPLDRHVSSELEFHLGAKVRVLRAEPEVLQAALASTGSPRSPSGPPLPLVRKVTSSELTAQRSAAPSAEDEPVLILSRPKSSSGVTATVAPTAEPGPAAVPALPLEQVEATFERTRTPDDVVAALLLGLAPARAVVLAVRSKAYVGRAGSPDLSQVAVRKLEIATSSASVVQTATRSGFYLGVLPHTPAHAGLRDLFGGSDDDMYVASVTVSGHPSLVIVGDPAALGGSLDATKRVDELAILAGKSLERILVSRKRGA